MGQMPLAFDVMLQSNFTLAIYAPVYFGQLPCSCGYKGKVSEAWHRHERHTPIQYEQQSINELPLNSQRTEQHFIRNSSPLYPRLSKRKRKCQ